MLLKSIHKVDGMRRPPSYSDSYVYLPADTRTPMFTLTPIVVPPPSPPDTFSIQRPAEAEVPKRPWSHAIVLFVMKGCIHIFCISGFETLFYFLYVSQSENQGILTTINTYWQPLLNDCEHWGNVTREFLYEILTKELNKTQIDAQGDQATRDRLAYNRYLLHWSISYSGICAGAFLITVGIVYWKRIPVPWKRLFAESLMFVVLLGLYEYFFFRTIIYNYDTLATPELNQYLVDGAFQCLQN
jgi:hypothetical protein